MKNMIAAFTAILLLVSVNAIAVNKHMKMSPDAVRRYKAGLSVAAMTKNLQFDFAKANLRPIYNERLTQLAKLLVEGNYPIILRGHADAVGSRVPNWQLSQKRADAIKDFLVSKGVSAAKIVTTPFGSTIPVASNRTAEGRQRNRRVEIRLS
ncbi:OmpA family protein [Mucilaginibacter achroorhodeus]|uniref:OmpA family protein n=1 Tax=Mucilaginibacter achroorhodeus TaxID=2599294 RepID=A0A563U798_9SPHI|nr:OmpA family protein [Mucilaginibacter achroorhodeus]TWR27227.1 OmpA family protein [Mucilaginibacter achroorhodeus]